MSAREPTCLHDWRTTNVDHVQFLRMISQILSGKGVECKPFKKSHEEQLKLVTSFAWIDFEKLKGIDEDIRRIFDQAGEYMEESRKTAIADTVIKRIVQLRTIAMANAPAIDDTAEDVEEDIAEDYGVVR